METLQRLGYSNVEGASKKDIIDVILFYDACRTFMEDVFSGSIKGRTADYTPVRQE